MSESSKRHGEGFLGAVSAGCFFILLGAIFVTTPNLFDNILTFFRNFDIVRVPHMGIYLPAPKLPDAHVEVYLAVEKFSFIWGLFEIGFLALRILARSSLSKKAETASNVVFWLGASFLISTFLNETTTTTIWFAFWASIITLVGVSLIVRAIIRATVR